MKDIVITHGRCVVTASLGEHWVSWDEDSGEDVSDNIPEAVARDLYEAITPFINYRNENPTIPAGRYI